ncbi:hypothetical protein WR25_12958 [Diploscapter pachys]|uniref:Major facilitator superfamily (MFS) profile domain-containing protein n=1 Tax=Diploscapter pachys TaxID=2018661 RepID=A0A2A2K3D7_9BILA|nr:hypothetical protein WR25_12958 [Diploscapter pachys]
MSLNNSLKRASDTLSDTIRRKFSRKTWEHKEQLHTITESKRFFLFKVRWQISLLAHVGFAIAFGIRSNFGVAKNRMTSNFTDAYGYIHEQEFFWSPTELGMMESSFFYGYAVSQIPAGVLAAKFAPNILLNIGVLIASILNIVIAFTLKYHPFTDWVVMAVQCTQGLALGVIYPSMHGVWRHWAPPMERSKLATTTFTGSYVGVMVGLPLSASLVSYLSWSAPFYVYGCAGLVWSVLWFFVSSGSPSTHRYINHEEKVYITENVGKVATANMTLTTVPWSTILCSLPVWAIIICNFCRSWTFFLLLGNQLTYMKDVLNIDIKNSGFISMLPQLLMTIVVLASGQLADYFRSSGKMSTEMVRKLFNTLGFGGEAIFLCALAFVQSPVPAVVCLITAATLSGMCIAGFNVNHFDIAPRYASILMGLSNGIGALAGMGGLITNNLTSDNPSGWMWCFLLAMGVDVLGIFFYLIFARGHVLEWAREAEPEETFGEFVRRMSSFVQDSVRRKGPRKTATSYEKFDEESRENSSEMKPTSKSNTMTKISEETGNTENSESPENQEKLTSSRLETDRPRVSSDE